MLKEICENQKIVYYWTTQAEMENLKKIYNAEIQEWNEKKYRVFTFISGKEKLVDLTKELLVHNQKVLAEQENNENQTTAQEESAT